MIAIVPEERKSQVLTRGDKAAMFRRPIAEVGRCGTFETELMRLPHFIVDNIEAILAEWESFARSLEPGSDMGVVALRDHAESILRSTAREMTSAQTSRQQSEKAKGKGDGGEESDRLNAASEDHALDRLGSGFNLIEVVSEYRALRASVLHLWRKSVTGADERDLQELTRFNEAMDQSLIEAVRSYSTRIEESRELFIATLGHDLRAPLSAVTLSAQVLAQSGQLDEEHTEIASRVTVFVKTMTAMIHDLLDFTRTRLGRGMPVFPAAADLDLLSRGVLDEFRAGRPDRIFRYSSDGDVAGEWDAARLRQVLSNLVANALNHGDKTSEIEVTTSGAGPDVLLTVRNQGPPIPPAALATLFDPFVRPLNRPASPKEGVGLGLFIAREVVITHAGTIEVTSTEAEGTMFTVRLPRKPPPEPHASEK